MSRTWLLAIGLGLLAATAAACSELPFAARTNPTPEGQGRLQARVALKGYQTQELVSDVTSLWCRVTQGSLSQTQVATGSDIGTKTFAFALGTGTASVYLKALGAVSNPVGTNSAVVGIQEGQVTVLNLTLDIVGDNNSLYHPMLPFPISGATSSL